MRLQHGSCEVRSSVHHSKNPDVTFNGVVTVNNEVKRGWPFEVGAV